MSDRGRRQRTDWGHDHCLSRIFCSPEVRTRATRFTPRVEHEHSSREHRSLVSKRTSHLGPAMFFQQVRAFMEPVTCATPRSSWSSPREFQSQALRGGYSCVPRSQNHVPATVFHASMSLNPRWCQECSRPCGSSSLHRSATRPLHRRTCSVYIEKHTLSNGLAGISVHEPRFVLASRSHLSVQSHNGRKTLQEAEVWATPWRLQTVEKLTTTRP